MTEVHIFRPQSATGLVCLRGSTTHYAIDPVAECVFGVVTAGDMLVTCRSKVHAFEVGDLCMWDPSARHEGRPRHARAWSARLMIVPFPALESLLNDPDLPALAMRLGHPRRRDAVLALRFLQLHRLLEGSQSPLACETALLEWFGALLPQSAARPTQRNARRDPSLRRATELLRDTPERNVSLSELAAATGCTRHRLSRLFRSAYGLPPHRVQLAQRLRVARQMLERGIAIAEVAQRAGFVDQSHLHRNFKRAYGFTPARYVKSTQRDC